MIDPEAALLMAESRFALGRAYSAPLAGMTSGRLEFPFGAAQMTVTGDAPSDLLFDARFGSAMAAVEAEGETVRVIFHRHGGKKRKAEYDGRIALNPTVPWTIAFHVGVARLRADLQALVVKSLTIDGGVSQIEILLPRPTDTVPITIAGGMHQVTLRRPADVPVRLTMRGGGADIGLDHNRLGAVGGELVLTSPNFDEAAAARYEVLARGGASGLKIL